MSPLPAASTPESSWRGAPPAEPSFPPRRARCALLAAGYKEPAEAPLLQAPLTSPLRGGRGQDKPPVIGSPAHEAHAPLQPPAASGPCAAAAEQCILAPDHGRAQKRRSGCLLA